MYAVIQSGGKQYRVQTGDIFQIEKLEGEVGTAVTFDQVLFASKPTGESSQIWLGKPLLSGAAVKGEIVGQGRGEKVTIVKMKRRKQYRRTQGHRQYLTQVLVTDVDNGAGEKLTLSADDKKAKLTKFQSHLTPKGPAATQPRWITEGSKKKPKTAVAGEAKAAAPAKSAAPKAAAPKTATAAKKPAAAKKTTK